MTANRFQNRGRLTLRLEAIKASTHKAVVRELKRGGLAIENRAVQGIIEPPKTGRIYKSKHRKSTKKKTYIHQASAPGEFPAADTGRLHQSITTVVATNTPDHVEVETGANAPYATRLELGGSHTAANGTVITIAPRPFMSPSFEVHREAVEISVRAAIKRAQRTKG